MYIVFYGILLLLQLADSCSWIDTMRTLFGTDGVRGIANVDLTPDLALRLARAAALSLPPANGTPRFLVGRDTRLSGDLLEAAAVAGLCAGGAHAIVADVMPTPAVAYLVRAMGLDGGIVISASHNAFHYNGLKFLGPGGHKLSDAREADIESLATSPEPPPSDHPIGTITRRPDLLQRYVGNLARSVPARLTGLRLVADCANGALSHLAPPLLTELGAHVTPINCSPDGTNINEGGPLQPDHLIQAVRTHGADAGLAFDGDGDRIALADENGALLDGDQILAIWAHDLVHREQLANNTVVGTVMTNGGLEAFLNSLGCQLRRTPVGDRYVSAEMQRAGAVLGGETSGHVIFSPHLPSADALFVGAIVLALMLRTDQPLSALSTLMTKRPQISLNVPAPSPKRWESDADVQRAVARGKEILDGRGWLLVRASGTEPVIRITAESEDESQAQTVARDIAAAIEHRLGQQGDPQ